MEIILLERIDKLGQMGDVVRVKDGYARNFLLPRNKALRATPANMERFERDREDLEKRNADLKARAEKDAGNVDGQSFVIIRQAGDTGQLYGSVSTRDIAQAIAATGTEVRRAQVVLDKAIKQLGVYDIRLLLHPDVSVTVLINVARTEEEAERQARGEDVTAEATDEDEAAISVEEVFEDEEQARHAEEELAEAAGDAVEAEAAEPPEAADSEAATEAGEAEEAEKNE